MLLAREGSYCCLLAHGVIAALFRFPNEFLLPANPGSHSCSLDLKSLQLASPVINFLLLHASRRNHCCLLAQTSSHFTEPLLLVNPIQTGLFWSICDWGGGGALLGPPLCISGTKNARVMKFTHNDHLHTKKSHTQFWLATPNDDVTVTSYSDFSMFLIIFPLRYVKYQ